MNIKLPKNASHLRPIKSYIEEEPDSDYKHASIQAMEAFKDLKFGVRIHWGIYSIWELKGESWPFLKMNRKKKQEYQNLYKNWNPVGFDADKWMDFFNRSGIKIFAFTTKHHEGFSMYDTKTRIKKRINYTSHRKPVIEDCDLAYSIMETPFKRDIVRELCESARKHNINIDLYFSHPDWYDANFRTFCCHPIISWKSIFQAKKYGYTPLANFIRGVPHFLPHPSKEEINEMMTRHREQMKEILTNYGKIDTMCLDMWLSEDVWPILKETIKECRNIQPDVMFRARGIGNYGDYYTPEGFVPGSPTNTDMPWMVIYPLGSSFSYEKDEEKHKGTKWIIDNLVDTAAKGGNFMVGIGPDANGEFHEEAIKELEATGKWLEINGEGIYKTRKREIWKDGDSIRFTKSKDNKFTYLFTLKWPESTIFTSEVIPKDDSKIVLLGITKELNWDLQDGKLIINIPEDLKQNKPCEYAWCFKIENKQ